MSRVIYHHVRNKNTREKGGATVALRLNDENQVDAFAVVHCHEQ